MKRIVIGLLLVAVAVFGYSYWRKAQRQNANKEFLDRAISNLEERRTEIGTLGKNLSQLEALVQGENWTNGTVSPKPGAATPTHLVWAEELRHDDPLLFDYQFSPITFLRDIVGWADGDSFPDLDLSGNSETLDREMAPLLEGPVAILEIRKLTRPEITTLNFDGEGDAGIFRRGNLAFTVAVVDPNTTTLLAVGSGDVSNSAEVAVRSDPRMLMTDLRQLAEQNAQEIMNGLMK